VYICSRDSVSLSVESWATSVTSSSVTSPAAARRRYDDADNNKHLSHHVTATGYLPYDSHQPVVSHELHRGGGGRGHAVNVMEPSLHCGRARCHGLDLAAAAADDDDHDGGRRNEVTRTVAVRPWLMHGCDR